MPFGIPPTLCWEEFGHQFANQESFLASREGPGAHFGDLVASIFTSWNPVPRKVQLPPARADQTDHFWEPKWKHFGDRFWIQFSSDLLTSLVRIWAPFWDPKVDILRVVFLFNFGVNFSAMLAPFWASFWDHFGIKNRCEEERWHFKISGFTRGKPMCS